MTEPERTIFCLSLRGPLMAVAWLFVPRPGDSLVDCKRLRLVFEAVGFIAEVAAVEAAVEAAVVEVPAAAVGAAGAFLTFFGGHSRLVRRRLTGRGGGATAARLWRWCWIAVGERPFYSRVCSHGWGWTRGSGGRRLTAL